MGSKDLIAHSQGIDFFKSSVGRLLVIAFPKSTSKNFQLALAVAAQASAYQVANMGGTDIHVATFLKTHGDASLAHSLLSYVSQWKAALVRQWLICPCHPVL